MPIWLCYYFFSIQIHAQDKDLHDELDQLINTVNAKLDNAEIKNRHRNNSINIEQLIQILDTAHRLIDKAVSYNAIAFYYSRSSRFDSVGYYARKAYQLLEPNYAQSEELEEQYISSLYFLGIYATMLETPSTAIAYLHQALIIIKQSASPFLLLLKKQVTISIGLLYRIQENYPLELSQYYEFLHYAKTHEAYSNGNFSNIYFNMAYTYLALDQLDSAIYYTKKGVEKAKPHLIAKNMSLLGNFLIEFGRYEEAKKYLLKGIAISKKSGKYWSISDCYQALARLYSHLAEYDEAVTYAEYSYDFALKSRIPQLIFSRGKQLANAYYKVGRVEEAFIVLKKNTVLEQSFINNKEKSGVQLAEIKEKNAALIVEKNENERQLQTNEDQRVTILFISGFSVLGIVLSLFIIFDRQKKIKLAKILKLRKEELEALDQSKSRFFANISHELRTPLTLISSPLKFILATETLELTPATIQMLQLMERNTKQLGVLVDDLLDLSKLEVSKLELQEAEVSIRYLLTKIASNYDSLAVHLGIRYHIELADLPDHWLMLDAVKVEKILNNLLSNAIKHTPSGGSVELIAQQENDQLIIHIRDSGQGIAKSDLPYIFERYYQSQQAEVMLQGGTGIGLALAKELSHLMKGEIAVDSELGKGSTFTLSLPYQEKDPTYRLDESSRVLKEEISLDHLVVANVSSLINKQHHVLIVEDHPEIQAFIANLLQQNYHIHLATHGKEALHILEKETIDLIVSDVMMPEMNGFELLEHIKGHDDYRSIPVIMLTALDREESKLQALTIGVDDYMSKPFSPQELLARAHNLVLRYKSRQEACQQASQDRSEEVLQAVYSNDPIFKEESREEIADTIVTKYDIKWIKAVESTIREEIENSNFTLMELADKFHLSERQFRRKIKEVTGLSPKKYEQEIILQKARELLEDGKYGNTTAIAYSVGMSHVTRFSKLYEARFGKKPSEYFND